MKCNLKLIVLQLKSKQKTSDLKLDFYSRSFAWMLVKKGFQNLYPIRLNLIPDFVYHVYQRQSEFKIYILWHYLHDYFHQTQLKRPKSFHCYFQTFLTLLLLNYLQKIYVQTVVQECNLSKMHNQEAYHNWIHDTILNFSVAFQSVILN